MKEFPQKDMVLSSSIIAVDEAYQRKIKQNEIKDILKQFNPNLVNRVKVSFRDGKYYVFDGQHTIAALVARNDGKPAQIKCIVFYGMTQHDEKELYKLQNGISSKPTAADKLRADYATGEGEPYALEIVNTLKELGIDISFNGAPGNNKIVCVSTLLSVYKRLTIEKFVEMFDIIRLSWDGQSEGFDNRIIKGMYRFVKTYDNYNKSEFVKKLRREDPVRLIARVNSSHGSSELQMARVLLEVYNKGRSTKKLPDKL